MSMNAFVQYRTDFDFGTITKYVNGVPISFVKIPDSDKGKAPKKGLARAPKTYESDKDYWEKE